MLVDTHCHLQLIEEREKGGAAAAVAEAREAGVEALICVGLGVDDNEAVLELARGLDGVYATAGWHPHVERAPEDTELQRLRELADDPLIVAIGEIGLDYYWRPGYHEVPVEVQQESFRQMLRIAREVDLPVVVHDREAHADVLALLREVPGTRGVMHAFSGDAAFAGECVAAGMHLSLAGPVTYPSAGALRDAVAAAPPERLLVETDSPFLPPQSHRGKPNTPALVRETAARVALIKGMDEQDFAEQSTRNARELFGGLG